MRSIEDLREIDSTLSAQLRLALASPLWKDLPYGVQINPRAWQIELLDVRPSRRIDARIMVPWRPGPVHGPPLVFILLLWHADRSPGRHRQLLRYQQRREKPASGPRRRLLFYDALSHGLVCQYLFAGQEGAPHPIWTRRMLRIVRRGARGARKE